MAKNSKGGSWKEERASETRKNKARPQSRKYSSSDSSRRPQSGTAKQYWRAGYTRKDGTRVKGHYVTNPNYEGKR